MKKIALTILMLAILFVAACTSDGASQAATSGGDAYIGGTQGITAVFESFGVEEDGVFAVFEDESFPIEATIRNKGEYEIQPGDITVKLLGPSDEEFDSLDSRELDNQDILEVTSELVPEGGEETLSFASDALYTQDVDGFIERVWFANIEYYYETYGIVPEVCLKEDLKDDRVCNIKEAKTISVSGAPITIRSVEESTAGKGVMALRFEIEDVAGGRVAIPGEDFETSDKLLFELDDSDWECKSGGKVNQARLTTDKATIVCKLLEPLQEDHLSTKQVKLTLKYEYRDIIQESLRIKENDE